MFVQLKFLRSSFVCLLLLPLAAQVHAQSRSTPSIEHVDLNLLIEKVARRTGKTFIVDPRVRAQVIMFGSDSNTLDYGGLVAVLEVHGFAAYESNGLVRVIPEANIRQAPVPIATGSKRFLDTETVTKLINVKSIPAPQLIPILRPMLPQYAHLAAFGCTNSILIVDRFANVERIANLIESMDKGDPYTPRECGIAEVKKE